MEGDQQQIQDLIQAELEEALETLSYVEEAVAESEAETDEKEKQRTRNKIRVMVVAGDMS